MRESNFSKNELLYLFQRDKMKEKYNINYIYQIKHTIKKKLERMVQDIELAKKAEFKIPNA